MTEKIIFVLLLIAAALTACAVFRYRNPIRVTADNSSYRAVVVLDAGHGGIDPGKVGVNGALEKDINLQLVFRLKTLLELNDIRVVLTRDGDYGLYDETDSNKKVNDMKRRVELIRTSGADLTVSIHQNSYTSESIYGAQVFYYGVSADGKELAGLIQNALKEEIDNDNRREIKANDSYYLLKKTEIPTVIVESGFLSNNREAELLVTGEYQERLAWAIHLGIMRWLNR